MLIFIENKIIFKEKNLNTRYSIQYNLYDTIAIIRNRIKIYFDTHFIGHSL
jgi:hypothetical protein